MSKSIAAVVGKMVAELESLNSDEERERAFAGARAVLGMVGQSGAAGATAKAEHNAAAPWQDGSAVQGISSAGARWIKRFGIADDRIKEVFHVEDGKVRLIGDAIGKAKREQTINTYLLTGVTALLETGKPDFTDEAAREYCVNLGCYDMANHSKTLSQFGNQITGSKAAGWKLTSPGLAAAAALLKTKAQTDK